MKCHAKLSFLARLSAGLLLILPFWDLINPFEWLNPQIHKQQRWRTVYPEELPADQVRFEWLGTTGFLVQKGDFIVLIDPYITRVPLVGLTMEPLKPNHALLEEKIPKADYIFITDSHFDHFLDTPPLARRTGAKVVGSATCAKLLRIFGVPEDQIIEVNGGETLDAGPFMVKVAKASHGSIFWIRPFYGDVETDDKPPLHVHEYANIDNRCYHFTVDGLRFFATSGNDVEAKDLAGFESDIVMANVTALPDGYIRKLLDLTKPRIVFPTHYDNFFEPYSKGVQPWPILDLKVFRDETAKWNPKTKFITFDFFQEFRIGTEAHS